MEHGAMEGSLPQVVGSERLHTPHKQDELAGDWGAFTLKYICVKAESRAHPVPAAISPLFSCLWAWSHLVPSH